MPIGKALRSRTLRIGALLLVLYWPIALYVNPEDLFELINGVLLAISVAVMIAYLPMAIEALVIKKMTRVHQLVLGIMLTWAATSMFRVWGIWSRANGSPSWMRDSPFLGFILYVMIYGGVLHITAPETIDDRVPTRTWITIGLACGAGGLVAGLILGSRNMIPFFGP